MAPISFLLSVCISLASPKTLPIVDGPAHLPINRELMLNLVNQVRQSGTTCGKTYFAPVAALKWNSTLEKTALAHSTDMLNNNYFSHRNKEGQNAGSRMEAAGYSWKAFGENIARGQRDEKEVLEGWLQSEGHCKNIMNATYTEIGVARAGGYWTQVFGSR